MTAPAHFAILGILTCIYFETAASFLPVLPRMGIFLLLYYLLAYLFQRAADNQLEGLNKLIQEAAGGNYSAFKGETNYTGRFKEIYASLEYLKNTFRKHISEIQVASSQVSSASHQLNVTVDDNSAFAQQLYAEAYEIYNLNKRSSNSIKTTVEEIKNIVRLLEKVQETSEQMRQTGNHSQEIIAESLGAIMEIVRSVNTIQESTEGTVLYINKLIDTTKEIASILDSVAAIAKATNLLALNAGIESARAGEHGKGFSVVAEQIRKLSQESSMAVANISSLLSSISAEVSAVTEKINDNKENVKHSVLCSRNVETSLTKIEESYKNVEDMIQGIILLSEKGNALAGDTSHKVAEVEETAQQVAAGFEMVFGAIQQQKDNIEQLDSLSNYLAQSADRLSTLFVNDEAGSLEISSEKVWEAAQNLLFLLKEKLLGQESLLSFNPEVHRKLLDQMLKQHASIEAIWTNDARGKFIYSNPPACIANAMVRDWFKESIQGKEFVSSVYISAITKNPCITVSLPITNASRECAGVLGADLKLLNMH